MKTNKNRLIPEIHISMLHKTQLGDEFGVSTQMVRMALKYVFHSPMAQKIRERAKELLIEEANNVMVNPVKEGV